MVFTCYRSYTKLIDHQRQVDTTSTSIMYHTTIQHQVDTTSTSIMYHTTIQHHTTTQRRSQDNNRHTKPQQVTLTHKFRR